LTLHEKMVWIKFSIIIYLSSLHVLGGRMGTDIELVAEVMKRSLHPV
jgi:hypothetical protein